MSKLPHSTPRIDRHNSKQFSKSLRSDIYNHVSHHTTNNNANTIMNLDKDKKEKRVPLSNKTNISETIEKIHLQSENWKLQKQLYKNKKYNNNEPTIQIFTNNKPIDFIQEENMNSFTNDNDNNDEGI